MCMHGDDDKIEVNPSSIIMCPSSSLSISTVYTPTCSESPTHSHTLGIILCRHNEVVGGVLLELLREGDDSYLVQCSGVVPVDQVGVRWVHAILNGATIF